MRRILGIVALALVACGAREVPVVSVAPLPVAATQSVVDATLLGECRIAGTGERRRWSREDPYVRFDVFAERSGREPSLVIATPAYAHVAWSHFPKTTDTKTRAGVALGGQQHVRFDGWASLRGRTFSAKKRMFAEPGHLWALGGAPVELLGADGTIAVARVETPFAAPSVLVVRGGCEDVAYDPDEPVRPTPPTRKSVGSGVNRSTHLALFAAPSGEPFTTLAFENDFTFGFDIIGRRNGFVRITGEQDDIGLDAWVRTGDVDEDVLSGVGAHGFGTSGCGGMMSSEHGVVVRDVPLFVGHSPTELGGAIVEKDAQIRYQLGDEMVAFGRVYVAFDFEDSLITAPEDQRLWIAKDAVQRK